MYIYNTKDTYNTRYIFIIYYICNNLQLGFYSDYKRPLNKAWIFSQIGMAAVKLKCKNNNTFISYIIFTKYKSSDTFIYFILKYKNNSTFILLLLFVVLLLVVVFLHYASSEIIAHVLFFDSPNQLFAFHSVEFAFSQCLITRELISTLPI